MAQPLFGGGSACAVSSLGPSGGSVSGGAGGAPTVNDAVASVKQLYDQAQRMKLVLSKPTKINSTPTGSAELAYMASFAVFDAINLSSAEFDRAEWTPEQKQEMLGTIRREANEIIYFGVPDHGAVHGDHAQQVRHTMGGAEGEGALLLGCVVDVSPSRPPAERVPGGPRSRRD